MASSVEIGKACEVAAAAVADVVSPGLDDSNLLKSSKPQQSHQKPGTASDAPDTNHDVRRNESNLARIRQNQRRSRARRKQYIEQLEERIQQYEREWSQASASFRSSMTTMEAEIVRLQQLVASYGIADASSGHSPASTCHSIPSPLLSFSVGHSLGQSHESSASSYASNADLFGIASSSSTRDWLPEPFTPDADMTLDDDLSLLLVPSHNTVSDGSQFDAGTKEVFGPASFGDIVLDPGGEATLVSLNAKHLRLSRGLETDIADCFRAQLTHGQEPCGPMEAFRRRGLRGLLPSQLASDRAQSIPRTKHKIVQEDQ